MNINEKISSDVAVLKSWVEKYKKTGKKTVLCQGHFNVVHPGHLRFLEFAKNQGDFLIVALQGKEKLEQKNRDKFFSEEERARGVAFLEGVERVFVFNEIPFWEIIKIVQPDIYVRGEEFAEKTNENREEIELVEKFGGKVMFRSGDIRYASSDFLDQDIMDIDQQHQEQFKMTLEKQNISIDRLKKCNDLFKDAHMLVIGDTIVDQYIACDALGMSAEAPVLVVRELENKEYVGGAAVVVRHLAALGAKCSFVSVTGSDEPGKLVMKALKKDNIQANLVVDSERPTTFKIRYMVGHQKLLRVTRLQDHYINEKIENEIIRFIEAVSDNINGIVVSDFVYGVITPKVLESISKIAEKKNIKLFGDVQSSSQIGNVAKFEKFDLITPTERESRIAMDDKYNGLELLGANLIKKTNSRNLVITLADKGFIAFQYNQKEDFIKSQHFPALCVNPVDVLGAGDALLAGFSLSMCAGADLMEAAALAAGVASIEVSKIGNTPVTCEEIKRWLGGLERN